MGVKAAAPLEVTTEDRSVLEGWSRSTTEPRARVVQARALLLAADGVANEEIARRCGTTPDTIRRWRSRFSESGVALVGVVAPGRGRKRSVPPELAAEIVRVTREERPGGGRSAWTTRPLAARFGVSKDTVTRIWRDHGLEPSVGRSSPVTHTRSTSSTDRSTSTTRGTAARGHSADDTSAAEGSNAPTGESLSADAIVTVAMRMIDKGGVRYFSVRALARELGVYPAAVHWHVGSRGELLAAVQNRWLRDVSRADEDLPWQAWIRETGRRYRAAAHAHPHIARITIAEIFSTTAMLALPESILSRLCAAGVPDTELVEALNVFIGAVSGFVNSELNEVADPSPAALAELKAEIERIDPTDFPTVARLLPRLANRAIGIRWTSGTEAPLETSFEYLLNLLIAGIERRIELAKHPHQDR